MRVSRHDNFDILTTLSDHRRQKAPQLLLQLLQRRLHPEFRVRGDLVVPRAASVKFSGDFAADDLAEAPLVGGVNVFVGRENRENVFPPFLRDLIEPGLEGIVF